MILLISLPILPGSSLIIEAATSLTLVIVVLLATSFVMVPVLSLVIVSIDPVHSPMWGPCLVLFSPTATIEIASVAAPGVVLRMESLLTVLTSA